MKLTERYTREYLYSEMEFETGLVLSANNPKGFVANKEWVEYYRGSKSIKQLLENTEVQFGDASDAMSEYILRNFRRILQQQPTIWRIDTIMPRPGKIRLMLACGLEDFYHSRPAPTVVDFEEELVEKGGATGKIDIYIEIYSADNPRLNLDFDCEDERDPEEICRIELWGGEHTRVNLKCQKTRLERETLLSWKDEESETMLAEIEETH